MTVIGVMGIILWVPYKSCLFLKKMIITIFDILSAAVIILIAIIVSILYGLTALAAVLVLIWKDIDVNRVDEHV